MTSTLIRLTTEIDPSLFRKGSGELDYGYLPAELPQPGLLVHVVGYPQMIVVEGAPHVRRITEEETEREGPLHVRRPSRRYEVGETVMIRGVCHQFVRAEVANG